MFPTRSPSGGSAHRSPVLCSCCAVQRDPVHGRRRAVDADVMAPTRPHRLTSLVSALFILVGCSRAPSVGATARGSEPSRISPRPAPLAASTLATMPSAGVSAPLLDVRAGTSVGPARVDGTVLTTRVGHAPGYAILGAAIHAEKPHVFSISNANDQFMVWVRLDALPPGTQPYLLVDALVLQATGTVNDAPQGVNATFVADRDQALRIARVLGVQAAERVPLDSGLTYTWRADGTPAVGGPVMIVLRIENHGQRTVRLMMGGRQRGPRDNRFSFRARVTGVPLRVKEVLDFGGLSTDAPLAPGAYLEVQADLRGWVEFERPGTYEVDCQYDGELFPDTGGHAQWPEHAHETWAITVAGSLLITLR